MTSERPVASVKVTPEQVRDLYEQGNGRNAIMRITGATRHAVDKACGEAGVKFDPAATRAAVESLAADAALERAQLAATFREVARVSLAGVLQGGEGMQIADRKDLTWMAGSAAASDARLGELALRERQHNSLHGEDSEAKEQFGAMLESIRSGFDTLEREDTAELEESVGADDEWWEDEQ